MIRRETLNPGGDQADVTNIVRSESAISAADASSRPEAKIDPSTGIAPPGAPFPELDEAMRPRPAASRSRKRPGRFIVATAEHDELIRALLRNNPMPGPIHISLEREPNYFAGAKIDGTDSKTILSIENDHAICAGSASARVRFLNGAATRVGYLGGLRLDTSHRGRASILLRAYQYFRELHRAHSDPPRVYLSSILARNLPAIRFLERNLPEMPTYTRLGDLCAMMIRTRRRPAKLPPGTSVRIARTSDLPAIAEFLNQHNAQYQFAPFWTVEGIQSCTGLIPSDFHMLHDAAGTLIACGAIWDQRPVRQTVIRGYSPRLRRLRPIINFAARLLRRPGLQEVGHVIPLAFASHVAATTPQLCIPMLQSLRAAAFDRGIRFLNTSFDSRDPHLGLVRDHFHPREYPSRLYVVRWDDGDAIANALDNRLLNPDVALL